jgi:hypothetical protein
MPPSVERYFHREFFVLSLLPFSIGASALSLPCIAWGTWRLSEVGALFLVALFWCAGGTVLMYLVVEDEGDELAAYYWLFKFYAKRVKYADIESVELGKRTWMDGLGISFSWRGGWTCNSGGLECVVIHSRGRNVFGGKSLEVARIATSDFENLFRFLRSRVEMQGSPRATS